MIDLSSPIGENQPLEKNVVNETLGRMKQDAGGPIGRQYQVLCLSGGAVYGAYTAGVLNGWSRSGTRPEFDIVTGVSAGGLIATYAFLGSAYDPPLGTMFTTIDSHDVYRERPKVALLWSDAAASSDPLRHMIEERIDAGVLQQVAQSHARGRRLYIGTTDLDRRKFVVWDMGAIAASGRPDALELYRKVMLASASVPGFFPPVKIDVCINGTRYSEVHGDGGASSQVFMPATVLKLDKQSIDQGRAPLTGSDVYVILAGKMYADPTTVDDKVTAIAGSALTALTFAQTRNDLIRIWTICQLSGMRYHSASIPQETPVPKDSLAFEPAAMRTMYEVGYCNGLYRDKWRSSPPDSEPNEQLLPRTGTDFQTPYGAIR